MIGVRVRLVSRMRRLGAVLLVLATLAGGGLLRAENKKPAAPAPHMSADVLVLSNGDTLHGRLVSAAQGKITFHSDVLGDLTLSLDKVKELHTGQRFAVVNDVDKLHGKRAAKQVPLGTLEIANQRVIVHPENGAAEAVIPVKNARYIMDEATLNKEEHRRQGFLDGWNGTATAGATLVTATQNQYTMSGAVGLVRVDPVRSWLHPNPRNRTSLDFNGSFGKITQPAYTIPANSTTTPPTPATYVAAVSTKTALYHADAERDEYFSPRIYALAQTAFDYNFSQSLALQQIYGGGIGWTAIKKPREELDLKATAQYESQQFLQSPVTAANPTPAPASPNMNLVGSTFSANYVHHMKMLTYTQGLSFIPSYNQLHAYSANETNTVAFPAYKNLSFTMGTLDSYLNDTPVSEPPTKPNSFQFTMGLSYSIKAKR